MFTLRRGCRAGGSGRTEGSRTGKGPRPAWPTWGPCSVSTVRVHGELRPAEPSLGRRASPGAAGSSPRAPRAGAAGLAGHGPWERLAASLTSRGAELGPRGGPLAAAGPAWRQPQPCGAWPGRRGALQRGRARSSPATSEDAEQPRGASGPRRRQCNGAAPRAGVGARAE